MTSRRRSSSFLTVAACVAGLALVGCASSGHAPARPLAGPASPGPARSTGTGPELDAHGRHLTLGAIFSDGGTQQDVDSYTALTGVRPAIVGMDQSWREPLYYQSQRSVVEAAGAVPMITWDPALPSGAGVRLSSILAGDFDPYLERAAAAARDWPRPLYVRLAHEMNLNASPFGPGRNGNTPALFVAAWRHVVSIFERAGATNVRWVWSPNVDCAGHCPFEAFYPGDAWVDWVALDGYNYAAAHDTDWLSFAQVFGDSYRRLELLTSKPIMIAETASVEDGGDKARWILDGLLHTVPEQLSRVRAVVWWERQGRGDGDLRIESSPSALAAFRRVARSPTYGGG